MELRTARLRLRPARAGDLAAFHAILSNPDAMTYWSTLPHADLETTRAWLDSMVQSPADLGEDFVIEREDRVIGKAGAYRLPDVGFLLDPACWGRGFAQEAMDAVISHLFRRRDVVRLAADVDPRNRRSIALLERLGFERTGSAERTYRLGELWTDSVYFELKRTNYLTSLARKGRGQDASDG